MQRLYFSCYCYRAGTTCQIFFSWPSIQSRQELCHIKKRSLELQLLVCERPEETSGNRRMKRGSDMTFWFGVGLCLLTRYFLWFEFDGDGSDRKVLYAFDDLTLFTPAVRGQEEKLLTCRTLFFQHTLSSLQNASEIKEEKKLWNASEVQNMTCFRMHENTG